MALTVSAKGQVTIPKHLREALGLSSGSKVYFVLVGCPGLHGLKFNPCNPGRF